MEFKITKILFTATATAPTFLSLGLIGVVKNSEQYLNVWRCVLCQFKCPGVLEWWAINVSFFIMIVCLIGVNCFLNRKQSKKKEANTIKPESYSNMAQIGSDQVLSSIIPWLTVFADQLDFKVVFACIILQCCFIAIASYNHSNYNMICSILGYRYYEVKTKENTYIFLSKKCIRNRNEIKKYADITDYMGLIVNE